METTVAVVYVVAVYLRNKPYELSRIIAERCGLSRDELVGAYRAIQQQEKFRRDMILDSRFPEFSETFVNILEDTEWLYRAFCGEAVFPKVVEYHPSAECNYDCTHCFSRGIAYEELGSEPTISSGVMMGVMRMCYDNGVEHFWLSGGKEPLVNPDTSFLISYANLLGLKTRLYTNGFLMDEHVRKNVLGCQQVRISMDAADAGVYHQIHFPERKRKGDEFDVVYRNIRKLVGLKSRENAGVRIAISLIVQPDNCHQLVDFVELGNEMLVDSVQIRREAVGGVGEFTPGEIESILAQVDEINSTAWFSTSVDIRGLTEGELSPKGESFPEIPRAICCMAGRYKRGINPWGKVYYCEFTCHPVFARARSHLLLGSLKNNTMEEILERNKGKLPCVDRCVFCQSQGIGLNWQMEKLKLDAEFGIMLEDQPFRRV